MTHAEEIMRAVICMFDSGYTLPQGREVMNYFYPLQYGIEGIKNICKEKIDQSAGVPEMDRIYFYKAVHVMLEGMQKWINNHAAEARWRDTVLRRSSPRREKVDRRDG